MKISQAYNLWAGTYNEVPNKTRDLEAKAIRASFTALDFSEKMLEKARELDPRKKVNFIQTDLQNTWPVAAVNFDLISCSLVLEHIEDLDFIFQEASRILVKKGGFYLCELHPFKQYLGSKARFETAKGTKELEVYLHHISDYINAAEKSGLKLKGINEYFDQDKNEIPRLISFLFEK